MAPAAGATERGQGHFTAARPGAYIASIASRWPIEQQYRELKDDLGLDHFEGRTYQGWTHHVVLTAVAFTFLQIERARAPDGPRPTMPVVRGWALRPPQHAAPSHARERRVSRVEHADEATAQIG